VGSGRKRRNEGEKRKRSVQAERKLSFKRSGLAKFLFAKRKGESSKGERPWRASEIRVAVKEGERLMNKNLKLLEGGGKTTGHRKNQKGPDARQPLHFAGVRSVREFCSNRGLGEAQNKALAERNSSIAEGEG